VKGRRFFAPEVVQTSAMDCGPAALKCLLEGFGIPVSYGRLREACQTDVDGTSIDTLEEVAGRLGLEAEQIMLPRDHFFLPEARALPAIIVTRRPDGLTHFVVAWRRHGKWLQIMDPATGRRWVHWARFRDEVYVHRHAVPAADWRAWASSEDFQAVLKNRLESLGADREAYGRLRDWALADAGWRGIGALDASVRMVDGLVRAGGIARGSEAAGLVERFFQEKDDVIPDGYWSVRPEAEGRLILRGAVLVRVRGVKTEKPKIQELPQELAAALTEPPVRSLREMLRFIGKVSPGVILVALVFAAIGTIVEALLFRGMFDLARQLGIAEQRLAAVCVLLLFLAGLVLLEFPIVAGVIRIGRHLEIRLRSAFLEKLPRLVDRYFRSRPSSDMAERSHSLHALRSVPPVVSHLIRVSCELLVTMTALALLHPGGAPLAVTAALVSILLPLVLQPLFTERDLRIRTHSGALSRFYLDSLLGLAPIRSHAAERPLRRQHEALLVEWAEASLRLQRLSVAVEGILAFVGFGLTAWLLVTYLGRGGEVGGSLLLVYWALSLPSLGSELALVARQIPRYRNLALRLLEPLSAPEEPRPASAPEARTGPVRVDFEDVGVLASGHTVLEGVRAGIAPGEHVAVVGPSGAGKSTLVGLLLGLQPVASGRLLIDGEPLDAARVDALRRRTVWVDPEVQLWNRSLLDNLRYGTMAVDPDSIRGAIENANLGELLSRLPGGMETPLGEGGGLVSGGEGQRVRFARGLLRVDPGLVILDEPFRGLDRDQRRALLGRARRHWRGSTLLCVTHDVGETREFDRVLVIEGGRLVEDGAPGELESRTDSRYRALVEAERELREGTWGSAWRKLRVAAGRVEGA